MFDRLPPNFFFDPMESFDLFKDSTVRFLSVFGFLTYVPLPVLAALVAPLHVGFTAIEIPSVALF